MQSAKAFDESGRDTFSLQELTLVVPRPQHVQTSLAINRPRAERADESQANENNVDTGEPRNEV
jgi:hypothetical protein